MAMRSPMMVWADDLLHNLQYAQVTRHEDGSARLRSYPDYPGEAFDIPVPARENAPFVQAFQETVGQVPQVGEYMALLYYAYWQEMGGVGPRGAPHAVGWRMQASVQEE